MDNNRENRILVAQQNRQIVRNGYYEVEGRRIPLLPIAEGMPGSESIAWTHHKISQAQVFFPDDLNAILEEEERLLGDRFIEPSDSELTLNCLDTFSAARALTGRTVVLNFANAHNPGGGYLGGSSAQEESLCRCSTLYASLTSTPAHAYYGYNDKKRHPTDTDAMILSRNVCVFRDADTLELLPEPYLVAVITAAAPDRRKAAAGVSRDELYETFSRRINQILNLSALYGYENIVLGAWGCGAFGNDPEMVADCFRQALHRQRKQYLFENVVFAIKGKTDSANYEAFEDYFENELYYKEMFRKDEPLQFMVFDYPAPALSEKMLNLSYAKITAVDDETGDSTSVVVKEDKKVLQGLLPDGRPFLAHLWKDQENPLSVSMDFVFSPVDIPIDDTAFEQAEADGEVEMVRQTSYGIGESDETEFIVGDYNEILGMVSYLKECGMVEFTGKYENGYTATFEDAAGEPMQLVRIMLVDEKGETVAKTPIAL